MVLKTTADREMAVKESHCLVEKVKGMALILAIVGKLILVGASKTGQPEGALRIMKRGFANEVGTG
jgi:hypothetical protein